MNRSRCLVWVVAVVFSLLAFEATALGKTRVFRGRVIDFDTKQPLEGAVVVAYWLEAASAPLGEVTRLKEVKECVTDSNGEWSLVGEEGHPHNPYWYLFPLVGLLELYYTRNPNFIIFKPGYCSWPQGFSVEECNDRIQPSLIEEWLQGPHLELGRLKTKDRLSIIRNIPSLGMASEAKSKLPIYRKLVEDAEKEISWR